MEIQIYINIKKEKQKQSGSLRFNFIFSKTSSKKFAPLFKVVDFSLRYLKFEKLRMQLMSFERKELN